nr:MAG TPA: hypothetical protein [Caudoviricetes sp.]
MWASLIFTCRRWNTRMCVVAACGLVHGLSVRSRP